MEATLTLSQAGSQLGVDTETLNRLITMGALPEARRIPAPKGSVWVIPRSALAAIAARNGWSIDLRNDEIEVPMDSSANPEAMSPANSSAGGADETASTGTLNGHRPIPASSLPVPRPGAMTRTIEARSTDSAVMPSEASKSGTVSGTDPGQPPSVAEVLDLALLDRLLGSQEERAAAEARLREANHALSALNETHNRMTSELEVERRERLVASDRFREEREARLVADAKVAELRDRMTREVALAEAERQARVEAVKRSTQAETDMVSAVSSMGWLARRRFRRARGSLQV